MLFSSFRPNVIVPKVEARFRQELGLGPEAAVTVATDLEPEFQHFLAANPTSGSPDQGALFSIVLRQTQPREMETSVHLIKTTQGFVIASRVVYRAPLAKIMDSLVTLRDSPVFEGDPAACVQLNGAPGLGRAVMDFARTELKFSNRVITAPRQVAISPAGPGSQLVIQTMPRLTWFGLKANIDPQVFVHLAGRIEGAL